jgi:tripartite-type tricarboxylate transporter receptor subunit TctC
MAIAPTLVRIGNSTGAEIETRRRILLTALAILGVQPAALAGEPAWPSKPVHIIVTGAPGQVPDIMGRWLAEHLTPLLGQPVVIDNKPGAGGNIATAAGARSAPDGYTLLLVTQGTMALNPHLYDHLGYDPLVDFAPITRLSFGSLVLAVSPNVPATSVSELVQLAKARPGTLNYGSTGTGSPPHLASALFTRAAGIEATHVPYKGGGGLSTDLLAGRLTWSIESTSVHLPMIKAGRLRALATTGLQRKSSLPDVPTLAESGLPGFEFVAWLGIVAPAATPKPVLDRLYTEIAKVLASSDARDWFGPLGSDAGGEPPAEFSAFIRAEHAKWGKVIREAGIKVE